MEERTQADRQRWKLLMLISKSVENDSVWAIRFKTNTH